MVDVVQVLSSIVGAAIFGLLIYGSFKSVRKAWMSRNWQSVAGKITKSKVVSPSSSDNIIGDRSRGLQVQVEYLAEIEGVSRIGDAIHAGFMTQSYSRLKKAQSKADDYPVDKTIDVYYNPEDHSDLLLDPGLWIGHYVLIIFWIIMLSLFGYLFIVSV